MSQIKEYYLKHNYGSTRTDLRPLSSRCVKTTNVPNKYRRLKPIQIQVRIQILFIYLLFILFCPVPGCTVCVLTGVQTWWTPSRNWCKLAFSACKYYYCPRGSDGLYCFRRSCLAVSAITHEPLHAAWWKSAPNCIFTTARNQKKFKVMGQRLRSQDQIVAFFTIAR